jgi:glycosyltransferase involved in cell wall biosynthesis
MKVLQVIDTLNIGGAEKVLVTLTNLLQQKQVTADVLLLVRQGALIKDLTSHAKVYHLNRQKKFSYKKLQEAHNICTGYNIVHVHMRHCYAYIRLAQIIFRGKYKLVFQDHFGDIEINKTVPFSLSGIFKPKYYIGVSPTLVQWAKQSLKIADKNYFLLLNTITPPKSKEQSKISLRNKVMLVSNIRPTKNIEFAISLCAAAKYDLTIYGNREDENYYKSIRSLCDKNSVAIKEGITDLSNEYSKYDIAIHCSRSETGPLVLLEYMANGMPFLAYKIGAVADTVAEQLPLYFIDNFQTDEWQQRIDAILAKEEHNELVDAFNQFFSPETYINNCLQIYQSVNS